MRGFYFIPMLISMLHGFAKMGDPIPGCYIITMQDFAPENDIAAVKSSARNLGKITAEFSHALKGFSLCNVQSDNQLNGMRSNPNIAWIEQDSVVQANGLITVNNPLSWGLDRIDQRTSALNLQYNYNDTTVPVNVYVVDTGIQTTHVEFGTRAVLGYNAYTGLLDANDCNGHGTHCAGTIGGTNTGVCKHCRIIAVKVLDCTGSGSWTNVINGINWVISNSVPGVPSVISMSLGGTFIQSVN